MIFSDFVYLTLLFLSCITIFDYLLIFFVMEAMLLYCVDDITDNKKMNIFNYASYN